MNNKYVIIGGVNKAGTTSLFTWLAAHPQICPSYIKQTFFFLDKSWQQQLKLSSLYDYEKGFGEYDKFFHDCKGRYCLEASPEYLYSPGTPQRLCDFFSANKGKLLFILRNPVTRFVSLFYFGKKQGILPSDYSFHEFIRKSETHSAKTNTSLMAFETGFYSKYLEKYFELLGKENISIYFFEDLMAGPMSFMKRVAEDIGIDAEFYNSFQFDIHNKTIALRNRTLAKFYNISRAIFIKAGFRSRFGVATAQMLKKTVTPLYWKLNTTRLEMQRIDQADLKYLEDAYETEKFSLEKSLGAVVPWQQHEKTP